MHHGVRPLGGTADGFGIGEIANVRVEEAGGGHTVKAAHAFPTGEQFVDDGLTDASGGTGDKDEFGGHWRSRIKIMITSRSAQ